ncbi:hypothetical protein ES705_16378 [subsurface metagenome]
MVTDGIGARDKVMWGMDEGALGRHALKVMAEVLSCASAPLIAFHSVEKMLGEIVCPVEQANAVSGLDGKADLMPPSLMRSKIILQLFIKSYTMQHKWRYID